MDSKVSVSGMTFSFDVGEIRVSISPPRQNIPFSQGSETVCACFEGGRLLYVSICVHVYVCREIYTYRILFHLCTFVKILWAVLQLLGLIAFLH